MIVRSWRGRAAKGNAAYVEHFRRNVMPELREIEGFLGASLLREERAADVEFLVLTRCSLISSAQLKLELENHWTLRDLQRKDCREGLQFQLQRVHGERLETTGAA